VENVEHEFVIRLLKEAKDFIHLVIKRKTANNQKANVNENTQNGTAQKTQEQQQTSIEQKRHNLAIQQTAATVMANYANTYQNGHAVNKVPSTPAANNNTNLMSNMMNSSHSISSLKPIKLTFNRKDKKELYGIVVGCKYYIKEILPDSLAANEANLKLGDLLLKLNDFDVEQISVVEANRILTKSKENKLHLVVKRSSVSSFSGGEEEELVNEMPTNQIANGGGESYDQRPMQPPSQQQLSTSTPQHSTHQQFQQQQQQQPTSNGHYQNMNGNVQKKEADIKNEADLSVAAQNGKMPPPLPPSLPPQPPQQLATQQQEQPSCSVIKQLFKSRQPQNGSGDSSRVTKFYSKYLLIFFIT
jgi:hypothetical protein